MPISQIFRAKRPKKQLRGVAPPLAEADCREDVDTSNVQSTPTFRIENFTKNQKNIVSTHGDGSPHFFPLNISPLNIFSTLNDHNVSEVSSMDNEEILNDNKSRMDQTLNDTPSRVDNIWNDNTSCMDQILNNDISCLDQSLNLVVEPRDKIPSVASLPGAVVPPEEPMEGVDQAKPNPPVSSNLNTSKSSPPVVLQNTSRKST